MVHKVSFVSVVSLMQDDGTALCAQREASEEAAIFPEHSKTHILEGAI